MTESRDLRHIYDVEWSSLSDFDLELKIMIVYDKQTQSYECLYNKYCETSIDLVDTIKKRLKERKEQEANNDQHL